VEQHFFVNDVGAQIGLTVLGYSRIVDSVTPSLKIDQWIGMIYAVMNTLSELQLAGVVLGMSLSLSLSLCVCVCVCVCVCLEQLSPTQYHYNYRYLISCWVSSHCTRDAPKGRVSASIG
jgi:hypothetical protein